MKNPDNIHVRPEWQFYRCFFKRVIDIFFAFLGLLLLSPVLAAIIIVLSFLYKGKPFFFQRRLGKNEKAFLIVKFRSMAEYVDAEGNLLADSERLTPLGRIMRNTSLDELPQLINVLKGDMSLVGPRPFPVEYRPLFEEIQSRRHEIRPGITGWAQVNGRNSISRQQKFAYDVWYVDHISFIFDFKILFSTFGNLLPGRGSSRR